MKNFAKELFVFVVQVLTMILCYPYLIARVFYVRKIKGLNYDGQIFPAFGKWYLPMFWINL